MIRQRLLELQWRQLNHDELYHREIARLTVGDRMKHMALHLAKYLGHIAAAEAEGSATAATQHLVDIYIICLSAANTVNLDLGRVMESAYKEASTVAELGQQLRAGPRQRQHNSMEFTRALAIGVGQLAKACESLDHVEAFAFREGMQEAVCTVFELVVSEAARRGIDLETATTQRQQTVRSRHMFDGYLRSALGAAIDEAGGP